MDLENIRREYSLQKLDINELHEDPVSQFECWFNQALQAQLSADPTAMTLSTVDSIGRPFSRIVLLKSFDQQGFVFYTNYESRKAQHIAQNSNVSLLFAWIPLERQVLINGTAEKLSLAESASYFHKRPRDSQLAAWASKQSRKISTRQMLDEALQSMKRKFAQGEIPLPPFWGGFRIKPEQMEFWQGGSNRLHDRFVYYRNSSNLWQKDRWQP
jgi:pyridoxamine 5'-phosphate oxidase